MLIVTNGLFVRESLTLDQSVILKEAYSAFLSMGSRVPSTFDPAHSFSVHVAYLTTKEQQSQWCTGSRKRINVGFITAKVRTRHDRRD